MDSEIAYELHADLAMLSSKLRRRDREGAWARSVDDWGRRFLDVMIAGVALFFLLPLLIGTALAIWATGQGPILFAHPRIGQGGRNFRCWKFRTMVVDAEARLEVLLAVDPSARMEWARDHKLRNDPRITPIGNFLRKSSLDEFPQLLNVLAGEMSLVGPRPIVRSEIPRYGRRFERYISVKPGITGLWQISGRNNTSYRRRVALDSLYVLRRSLLMDLRILIMTLPAVIMAKGSF